MSEAHGDENLLDQEYLDRALVEVVECILDCGYYPRHGTMRFDLDEFLLDHLKDSDIVLDLAERMEQEES
jgi:hypothetical protein